MSVLRSAILIAIAAVLLPLGGALAQQTQQQERMRTCNADAGARHLSGDARKSFMSDCLSGKATAGSGGSTPQDRMKACNARASDQKLGGDARKAFMSSCLKG